jgi:hypothetical protein
VTCRPQFAPRCRFRPDARHRWRLLCAIARWSTFQDRRPSTSPAGDFGEALHGGVMLGEQIGHLLIELVEVIGDHAELLERELTSRR